MIELSQIKGGSRNTGRLFYIQKIVIKNGDNVSPFSPNKNPKPAKN